MLKNKKKIHTYTHIHTHTHTYIHTNIHTYIHTYIHTWVKAHNGKVGNELADQLAKKVPNRVGATAYSKIPKIAAIKRIQEGELEWQKEWNASTKGEITKSFFPDVGDRKSKRLQMNIKLLTMVTGHGTLRTYYHRFKIINDPVCVCKTGPQTT